MSRSGWASGRTSKMWTAALAVAALALGAGTAGATALLGHHESSRRDGRNRAGAAVTTTATGTVIARRVDRRRGLVFEVHSSIRYGSGGSLYVRLAPGAPAATREAVFTRPLAATCAVPGQHVREFAGPWDVEVHQFGTALLTDDPSVVIANVATRCALWVGREGARPDTAYFDGPPFSRVRMR